MSVRLSIKERVERKLPRVVKHARRWIGVAASGGRPQSRLVVVVGSQRSGTRMPLTVLDHAPEIMTWSEGAAPYFDGVLLQPLDRVAALVRRSIFPVVVLKPICETHRVNEVLARFPGSKAIWIFRHYEAAVSSASVKWKSGREAVRRLAEGELRSAGWRAGGLTQEKLELVRHLYRPEMSLHEANAVMWYLRNGLFFDLKADTRRDVMLVRYEDLVTDPVARFSDIFRFIGVPIPSGFEADVRHTERERKFPLIAEEIRQLCDELYARLLAHYRSHTIAVPAAASR